MNIQCTYNGETVNVVSITPHQETGFVDIVYIDSSNIMKNDVATYVKNIGSDSIIISGLTVSDPVFYPAGGEYASTQSVSITAATAGALIYYTDDL